MRAFRGNNLSTMADLQQELTELLAKGDKIGAIKRLREHHGLGLKEAKDAIDGYERGTPLPAPRAAPVAAVAVEFSEEVRALAVQGRKLDAIKLLREQTGMGLAEAKAAVESVPGASGKSGCGAGLILLAIGCLAWATRA